MADFHPHLENCTCNWCEKKGPVCLTTGYVPTKGHPVGKGGVDENHTPYIVGLCEACWSNLGPVEGISIYGGLLRLDPSFKNWCLR